MPGGSRMQAVWAKRMSRGRGARSTPPSRCSAIAGACSSSATSSSETAAISESCRPARRGDRLKYSRRPTQATRRVGIAHPRGHASRPAGALQPDRTRDPARTRVRAARQLGTSPPAHEPRAARSRRAARTRRPRALARVHGRASPLAPWLRIPSAITERSRAPERGLPRCCQLLVAARRSPMSKGADGCRPSCLTCEPLPAQEWHWLLRRPVPARGLGFPYGRLTGSAQAVPPTLTRFPRSARMRYGRCGCPLYPGDDGVPRDHRRVRDRGLPPRNGWPLPPRRCTPTPDAMMTRHQQGFRVIHPSGLPRTCNTRSERAPSGFPRPRIRRPRQSARPTLSTPRRAILGWADAQRRVPI